MPGKVYRRRSPARPRRCSSQKARESEAGRRLPNRRCCRPRAPWPAGCRTSGAAPSLTRVPEHTAAAAVTRLLQLHEQAVGIGEVQLRCPFRGAAAVLHPHRDIVAKRTGGAGGGLGGLGAATLGGLGAPRGVGGG